MNRIGKQQPWQIAGMLLTVAALAACGANMDDLESYIQSVKDRPADPIPPVPSVKTYSVYEYEGLTERDPFRSSISEVAQDQKPTNRSGPRPDFERSREYLERYELDTLSMVGTFRKQESFWVLIRDPEGVVHRVAVGNFLGKNHGNVVGIADTRVTMSELISDGTGGWLVREASIALGEG